MEGVFVWYDHFANESHPIESWKKFYEPFQISEELGSEGNSIDRVASSEQGKHTIYEYSCWGDTFVDI